MMVETAENSHKIPDLSNFPDIFWAQTQVFAFFSDFW